MGFWSRLGKGTLGSIGVITTPFLTGLGVVADGIIYLSSLGVSYSTGGFIRTYDKPYATKFFGSLLAGSKTMLHEACAPEGKQSFISKAIEKSILGASFIASAVTAVAVMFQALPVLAGGAALAVGTFCVAAVGAAFYQCFALSGKKDKAPHPGEAQQAFERAEADIAAARRLQLQVDQGPSPVRTGSQQTAQDAMKHRISSDLKTTSARPRKVTQRGD